MGVRLFMDNNKLKIAMFGHKRIPSREGGIEIVVEELTTRMVEKGHEVVCYNRKGHHVSGSQYDMDSQDLYKGVKLKPVWTLEKKGLAAVTSSFFAAIKAAKSDADVVHIHAEGPAAMCWIPKFYKKRVIVTVHGLDWARAKWGGFATKYIKWGEKQAVKKADEIIVLSRGVQEYFKKEYGRKTVFIPNGVTKPDIIEAKEITNKFGLENNSYILFLGRIVPEKGIKYLIQAFRQVNTDKKLVIAGGISDTAAFSKELRDLASDDERIIFTNFVQGKVLGELYSNAYIYCLPSDLEGMPLSLLEAMSYGNCCLTSDIPECAEVVEDKAVLFQKGNVDDLKKKIEYLCSHPETVNQYKSESSMFILEKYDWDSVVDKTLELYGSNL